jgi:hypothetical protein
MFFSVLRVRLYLQVGKRIVASVLILVMDVFPDSDPPTQLDRSKMTVGVNLPLPVR